ncbi:MAG: ArsC/Spx/MgsR family protein [SAR202 cluster bacterium]|nr:ArsC/Spx/MgsR family protein [SAR202 cluster bacterium]MDP7412337.1 ArsC/Spx/MgsR family protein [SAR202 cluster bacterium]
MKAELSQRDVELDERDFFRDPFDPDELRALIGDRQVSDFFSFNSPSFRKLGVKRDELTDERMISLIIDEPRLIRRPLIAVGSELVVGTDKEAMARLFP